MTEPDFGAGNLQVFVPQQTHELPLLALHPIGMIGIAGQQGQIERRNRSGLPIAELPRRSLQPHRDHVWNDAELVEQVERRRMKGRAAQLHHELGLGGKHGGGNGAPRQGQRGRETYRPGADDDNAVTLSWHSDSPEETKVAGAPSYRLDSQR